VPPGVVAYATVQALCRALYADLLTPDLQAALTCAPDLETLLSQLRLIAYAPHLESARRCSPPDALSTSSVSGWA